MDAGLSQRRHPAPLCALFFLHAAALAAYVVPFPAVLAASGMKWAAPWIFCMSSVIAMISPMIAGVLADKRIPAERLLAWMTGASAVFLGLAHYSLIHGWGTVPLFLLMAAYQFANAPGFTLVTSIVLGNISDPQRQFGPIRAWATWGWMAASFVISTGLHMDASPHAGYVAAGIFVVECIFCCMLRPTPPPAGNSPRRWKDYLGLEALATLKNRDHRTIFITSAVFSALLSPLYLYTTSHLEALGDGHPVATMAYAQLCEGIAMFALSWVLLRFRLKYILVAGLALGAVRYALLMVNVPTSLFVSVCLHGIVFVLFYPTVQIYLEQRLDPRIRSQSQALLSLFNSGIGNLSGYLIIGWWSRQCESSGTMDWVAFWTPITVCTALLTAAFVFFYRGQGARRPAAASS